MYWRMKPALLGAMVAVLVSGCAAETESAGNSAGHVESDVSVLASTDVYATLAEKVVGETVRIDAIVDDPAVDPHSYEATPQDRLRVEEADVLIANGGGYDPYLTLLAAAAGKTSAVYQLIDGENWHSHEFDEQTYQNEHIWYDLGRMSEFVTDFAEHMSELVPANAEFYAENAQATAQEIDDLDERNSAIEASSLASMATEAVSGFLLEDAGFEDLTELEFLAAVEHGDDVSPRLFHRALDRISTGEVDLLSYNPQTETNQALRIREAAEEADIAVLEFSETLPDGAESYLDWMEHNISQIEAVADESST